jgi:hypothetical protein
MTINLNDIVFIKLTDKGRQVYKEWHDDYNKKYPVKLTYRPPKEDENGYSRWKLYEIMQYFGNVLYPHLWGDDLPFETTIEINKFV